MNSSGESSFFNLTDYFVDRHTWEGREVAGRRFDVGIRQAFFTFLFERGFSRGEWPRDAVLSSALWRATLSLGASWAFSLQPVLPPDCRPRFPLREESGPGD